MSPRIIKWIVIIAIGGGLGIWRATTNRSKDSDEVRGVAMKIVQSLDCYTQHKAVLDQCADAAHKAAFDQAYTAGRRRRSSEIDADKYLEAFFRALNYQFDLRNRPDLRKCVADTQSRVDKEAAEEAKNKEAKDGEPSNDNAAQE